MDDKILIAADSIATIFNETTEWLDPKRATVVKILKELVEGVQTQTNNNESMPCEIGVYDEPCKLGYPCKCKHGCLIKRTAYIS